jgi:hypothetical protein
MATQRSEKLRPDGARPDPARGRDVSDRPIGQANGHRLDSRPRPGYPHGAEMHAPHRCSPPDHMAHGHLRTRRNLRRAAGHQRHAHDDSEHQRHRQRTHQPETAGLKIPRRRDPPASSKEHNQAVPTLRDARANQIKSLPPAAGILSEQAEHLGGVPLTPRPRKRPQQQRVMPHAMPPCALADGDFGSRLNRDWPSATTRPISAIASRNSSPPASVISYGNRRSSSGNGAIRPRSTNRPIAPYNVPAPNRTPENASMSFINA